MLLDMTELGFSPDGRFTDAEELPIEMLGQIFAAADEQGGGVETGDEGRGHGGNDE